jgi:hypothetical protein
MTVNITMLMYGRPRLTEQANRSLWKSTPTYGITLMTFDDEAKIGTGPARNKVIEMSPRHEYLYLSDNDVFFKPHWLEALIECYEWAKFNYNVQAIGAYVHPYNQPVERWPYFCQALGAKVNICELYALSFQSWLMTWDVWDKYGKCNDSPPGMVRMGEDWEYSQRIRKDGGKVASILPPLIYNCGVTDSFGVAVPGLENVERPEGVIVE